MAKPTAKSPRVRPVASQCLGALLATALDARSMTAVELQRRLLAYGHKVSLATLSYWRSGERRPEGLASLEALDQIETILEMDAGCLRGSLGPSRRVGTRSPQASVQDIVPHEVDFHGALVRLDLEDWPTYLVEESVHITVDVDASGSMTHQATHALYRCIVDGARRLPVGIFAGRPVLEPFVLESVHGVRVGREVVNENVGLTVWELLLPSAMRVGDTTLIDTRVRMPGDIGEQDTCYYQHAVRRLNELTIWVRFSPDVLPRRCELVVQELGCPAQVTQIDVEKSAGAHLVLRNFGPGWAGIDFEW